jgi:hypothetical protein
VRRISALLAGLAAAGALAAGPGELTFHHLHLNDAGLRDFYLRLFDPALTSQTPVAGYPALRSGPMLLLFGQPPGPTGRGGASAASPAPTTPVTPGETAVWHFGWGPVSLGESYLQHAAHEVRWEPPLPAGQLHLHLLSRSPAAAADWYHETLGARVEVLASARDLRRAPAAQPEQRIAEAIVYFGDFALVIYRTGQTLVSTRGQRVDHVAFGAAGARLGESPATIIEGPDKIAIELIR